MESAGSPLISDLERNLLEGSTVAAVRSLIRLLRWFAGSGGKLPPGESYELTPLFPGHRDAWAAGRIAAAVSEIFCRADLTFAADEFGELLSFSRWITMCFAASSFGNTDLLLSRLGLVPSSSFIATAPPEQIQKMVLLYGPESRLPLDFSALFMRAPGLACSLATAILSSRLLATPAAHQKREILLKWLPEAVGRLSSIDVLPQSILVDLWMNSSYGLERGKHDIKKPLNALIRRQIETAGIQDVPLWLVNQERPSVFVLLEWFHGSHSIMRTHSISLRSLRQRYRLVGFGPQGMVDAVGREVFDEFHYLDHVTPDLKFLKKVVALANEQHPIATYFPSVGMALHTLYLVNVRLAPRQVMALGHPATTHSDKIDYVVVEEDYLGDPTLFSETVVTVPRNALPYYEPTAPLAPRTRRQREPVRVAVPAAVMKLNPIFLSACREIVEKAEVDVVFEFMLGGSPDLMHVYAEKVIASQVPGAIVHKTAPIQKYLDTVAACDLFANPFPFGNTNGIVDTVYCGLPGVCLSGDEVHEHIDEGMFRRMKFPEWTIARSPRAYVEAALRLINDEGLRSDLRHRISSERWDRVLYHGESDAFITVFRRLVDSGLVEQPQTVG